MKLGMRNSMLLILLLLTACATQQIPAEDSNIPAQNNTVIMNETSTAINEPVQNISSKSVDLKRLPLGGKLSTSPTRGAIWLCNVPKGTGGAQAAGPWIKDNSYDITAKPSVQGSVRWPGNMSIALSGNVRIISGNALPNHPTGTYPVAQDDPAYRYDRNPNSIKAQRYELRLPANPQVQSPSCIGGEAGIMQSGSALFNGLDAEQRDAVAYELQDTCQGHPERTGTYHYHSFSSCINDSTSTHSPLVGYALDGFGIYGIHGENGQELSSDDLDECHGHTHVIQWDGKNASMFHYHMTADYPYSIGCFRGKAAAMQVVQAGPEQMQSEQGGQSGPDLAVAAAKLGITEDELRRALGPPPPDLAAAAQKLGISEEQLREALGPPR
jgi:hypothetical protein